MFVYSTVLVIVYSFSYSFLKFHSIRMKNGNSINCLEPKSKQICRSVQESLKQIIVKQDFKSYKMKEKLISTKGGNYFGDLYEIDIKGVTNDGIKESNLFIKQAIKKDSESNPINFNSFYKNEIFIYTELSKIFNILQDEGGIPYNERFKMVKAFDESNLDAIILENMTRKGYETQHRMEVMTLDFSEMSIKQIAKLHGLSFILKHRNIDYYNTTIMKNITPLQFSEPMRALIKNVSDEILKQFDINIQKKLRKFISVIYHKLPKYLQGETGPVRCLCHGDFRINNILIKRKDLKLSEAILIDYQIMFFGSPVYDLLYFFYTGTDRQFRKDYMESLKDLYHDTLRDFLNYFDIDINEIYSKKLFQKDFETHLDVGLMLSFYALPFCFLLEDTIPDFSKDTVTDMTIKFDDRFITRFKGILDDYLEWGII